MKYIQFYFCGLIFLSLIACNTENVSKAYSINTLENNKSNTLQLPVHKDFKVVELVKEIQELDTAALEKRLTKRGLHHMEVSYLFYALGMRHFNAKDFNKGLHYYQIAAHQYLNPLAMLLLAHIYNDDKLEVQKAFPDADLTNFNKDVEKTHYYLHYGLNIAIMMQEHFNDPYIMREVKYLSTSLTELFSKQAKDSTTIKAFDLLLANERVKKDLPKMQANFEEIYGTLDKK